MGGFFLIRRDHPDEDVSVLAARAAAPFADQGLGAAAVVETPGCVIYRYAKRTAPEDTLARDEDGAFCFVAGTAIYRNRRGRAAAAALLADARHGAIDWDQLFGNYCLILHCHDATTVQTDRMGTYHVWHDTGRKLWSSAFLAVAAGLDRRSIDEQAVYEYVFQGSSYGDASVLAEVKLLDGREAVTVEPAVGRQPLPTSMVRPTAAALADHLERNLDNLNRYFAAIAACDFPVVDTALSGGYDSRLTLALLRAHAIPTRVHVYGRAEDADVACARAIAQGEGFVLHHVDKSRAPRLSHEAFAETVKRNHAAFDGFPADGIFDNGSDLATRCARGEGGALMLNGGGGEIFRNFFYLRDGRYTIRQLLWSFYSQFDPAIGGEAFSLERYYDRLEAKVRAVLGRAQGDASRLSRREVEYLYPHFRCRFWMGKNNSNNNRIAHSLTPFIDANVVGDALNLPLALKNHGIFEAAMIAAVDPALAAYPSAYGHPFTELPPLQRRIKDWTTMARPCFVRRLTFRLHRYEASDWPYTIGDDYLSAVIDTSFPYMRRLFRIERVVEPEQRARLATLEHLFETIQPSG